MSKREGSESKLVGVCQWSLTRKVLGVLFVNDGGQVTSIIKDHVQGLAAGKAFDGLLNTPLVLLLSLALPGEDGDASGGDARNAMSSGSGMNNSISSLRSGSMILSRKDILS
jgi:hypothetical protein